MICKNFVCVFSNYERGKTYCGRTEIRSDCNASCSMSCKHYKYFGCNICGHEFKCFKQREKGVFYSPDRGEFVPASSARFIDTALNNDLSDI